MRLAVIVPAFNEEESVGHVVSRVPRTLPRITDLSVLVVDDGSTDATAARAKEAGARVLSHRTRLGLAAAFRTGLAAALGGGADVVAILDADGQYRPEELSALLQALFASNADLAVGDRGVRRCRHMPLSHRVGNVLGSAMLRLFGTIKVTDASSGYRVFTRSAAKRFRITSEHTYTHEMLIQAAAAGMKVTEVPVTFLPRAHGKSKLIRTLRHHILRSCGTIARSLFLERPLRKFLTLALLCFLAAAALAVFGASPPRTEMLVASAILLVVSLQFFILGIVADANAASRRVELEHSHLAP